MAVHDTIRWVINGHLGQNEVFSTSFSTASNPVASQAAFQTLTTAGAAVIQGLVSAGKAFIDAAAGYDSIKAYYYGPIVGAPALFIATAPLTAGTGTAAAAVNPLQACIVATLQTSVPTRRTRGRMYLPITGRPLTNHQITSAECLTLSSAVATMFNGMNLLTPAQLSVVASEAGGTVQPVLSVKVDSRVDIQRRRAESETVLFSQSSTV